MSKIANMMGLSENIIVLPDGWRAAEPSAEPRCLCTHRWAEHYGKCQRPGCGCLRFEEAVSR